MMAINSPALRYLLGAYDASITSTKSVEQDITNSGGPWHSVVVEFTMIETRQLLGYIHKSIEESEGLGLHILNASGFILSILSRV